MPILISPGVKALDIWKALTKYTLNIDTLSDTDTTYVTVQDITGSGVLASVFWNYPSAAGQFVVLKITIDGTIVVNDKALGVGNIQATTGLPIMAGFTTSCKVEMKLGQSGVAWFGSVALVE